MNFLSLFTCVALLACVKAQFPANTSLYEANATVSSNLTFLFSEANQTIQTNSSHDSSATFLLDIGSTHYATIYVNWPVLSLVCKLI
jgi:hypothetical protein